MTSKLSDIADIDKPGLYDELPCSYAHIRLDLAYTSFTTVKLVRIDVIEFCFRTQQAEEMLKRSVLYMKLCQPSYSFFLMLANATLGTFFKVMDKPREAIQFLQQVVNAPGNSLSVSLFLLSIQGTYIL